MSDINGVERPRPKNTIAGFMKWILPEGDELRHTNPWQVFADLRPNRCPGDIEPSEDRPCQSSMWGPSHRSGFGPDNRVRNSELRPRTRAVGSSKNSTTRIGCLTVARRSFSTSSSVVSVLSNVLAFRKSSSSGSAFPRGHGLLQGTFLFASNLLTRLLCLLKENGVHHRNSFSESCEIWFTMRAD